MDKSKVNILLVEDDPNLSHVIQDYLEMLGYKTMLAKDGEHGLELFRTHSFHLAILDVMLPKKDGFALAQNIREITIQTPIIFLTAKALKEDRIAGFKVGCDDYMTKPFSSEELSLRIEAILKRCDIKDLDQQNTSGIYKLGSYVYDSFNMVLTADDFEHTLTRKEAGLLKMLCENKNQLLARETILKAVWGDDDYFIGRSMDVFITKLRKYLKHDQNISITNVHGTGFKLEVPE
ncbi:MAG: response regulator transcription factor [Bacteroidales bacterium]|nr:response regulator transcription factor [Bacteroidales bacterium]